MSTLFWRLYNQFNPQSFAEVNQRFALNSIVTSVSSSFMNLGLVLVILLRTLKMYENEPRHWFRIYTIIMTVIISIGSIGYAITGSIVFTWGLQYMSHPLYRIALLFGGFFMNIPVAIHMPLSAFVFLHKIYTARGFTIPAFLKDWILKQDGFRYVYVLGMNLFLLYCYVFSGLFGQNETTTLMFYAHVWPISACLMTFMENSYSTTKDVLKNSKIGLAKSNITSLTSHTLSQATNSSATQ
jgi:hypothetical protein